MFLWYDRYVNDVFQWRCGPNPLWNPLNGDDFWSTGPIVLIFDSMEPSWLSCKDWYGTCVRRASSNRDITRWIPMVNLLFFAPWKNELIFALFFGSTLQEDPQFLKTVPYVFDYGEFIYKVKKDRKWMQGRDSVVPKLLSVDYRVVNWLPHSFRH